MPKDTESKYFHAVSFFDYVEKIQDLENRLNTGQMSPPSTTPPAVVDPRRLEASDLR